VSEFNLTVKKGHQRYTFRVQRTGFGVQWVDGKLTFTLLDAEGFNNEIINQVLADTSSIDRIDIEYERDTND
jgi:hypothetical protein